jgi:hypothetical protein
VTHSAPRQPDSRVAYSTTPPLKASDGLVVSVVTARPPPVPGWVTDAVTLAAAGAGPGRRLARALNARRIAGRFLRERRGRRVLRLLSRRPGERDGAAGDGEQHLPRW